MSVVSGNYSHRVIGTIFLISFGIYLFLATVTYTPFDPGWMHVSSDTRAVSNASGISGAWVADFLYGLFGWAALLFPIFIFLEAIQLWWPRSYLTQVFRYAAQFFILLTSAALLYFFWQVPSQSLANAAGGIIGYEIAQSLAGLLSAIGAIIFLLVFWFTLWTLAFKIEWLKTPDVIRAIPTYLQDLFYKNIPKESEDFDLTVAKVKSSHVDTIQKDVAEHQPLELEEDEEILFKSAEEEKIRKLDSKIVTQPKVTTVAEEKVNLEDLSKQIVQSGQVWQPQPKHESVSVESNHQTLSTSPLNTEFAQPSAQVASQDIHTSVSALNNINQTPLGSSQETDLSDLIAEADRQLSNQHDHKQVVLEESKPSASHANMLDWSDDEVFDELLAAVPVDRPTPKPVQTASVAMDLHVKPTEIQDLKALDIDTLDDLDDLFNETKSTASHVHLDASVATSQPVNVNTTGLERETRSEPEPIQKELSKEEFIEAWHETAGKPEEFDWDDLDAPLTDASGRPVSRAMQVAEHRKHLSPLPGLDILDPVDPNKKVNFTAEQLSRLSDLLELKLQDFNVKAKVIEAHPGPVVTRFELDLAPGVKASKVTNISRDLARSMSMASVRVVEVIPGKPYIGIEVPNSSREMVRLIELLDTPAYRDPNALLSMAMGKDISGNPVLADLAKAPHMLVAGTTGSGKSVAVNAMLLSMLLKYTPQDLRLIMIDPKQLELANYNDIPHLLTPVVTDMKDAVNALNWCVNEMERRYKLMSMLKVRKLTDFNRKVREAIESGEDLIDPTWKPDDSATQSRAPRLQEMPLIVIVADEFADMIMQVGKKAEEMITRLAQKSRAAGIHLLLATQRPTVDVVTGLIKANIPTRAALRVNSKIDSRTILDAGGAEDLLGHGDMLFLGPGKIEPERVHGAFISDDEVNRICDAWRERGSPNYVDEILTPYDEDGSSASGGGDYDSGEGSDRDMLYDQCVAFVLESRKATASSLQRKFSLGYNRAARIIDQMEENGIVSPMGANGKRDIIV